VALCFLFGHFFIHVNSLPFGCGGLKFGLRAQPWSLIGNQNFHPP